MDAAPPPPQQAQVAPPTPQASTSRPPNPKLTIPYLTPQRQLTLCRGDALHTVVDVTLQVGAQEALPASVHAQMVELTTAEIGIDVDQFTRMWRTILLKRAQDVYERSKSMRSANHIRLAPQMMVPAPLGDLLYSLGSYSCPTNGIDYHLVPPAQALPPEDWFGLDAAIVALWNRTMARFQRLYVIREAPLASDFERKPLLLTSRNVVNDYVSVRTALSDVELSDGLIHAVNDGLFPAAHLPYANSHIQLLGNQYLPNLRAQYVASYVLDSHS